MTRPSKDAPQPGRPDRPFQGDPSGEIDTLTPALTFGLLRHTTRYEEPLIA